MESAQNANLYRQQQNHPDLEDLYFIDRLNRHDSRIKPNGDPVDIENDLYSGKLLIMIRTSDADLGRPPEYTGGTPSNDRISNYLRPKKRRFEIQFQLKFKQAPKKDSPVYLCLEYEKPVKLNALARVPFNAAVKYTKMKNSSFSYSLSGKENVSEDEKKQGMYENPHFAFPIETSLDVIKITKPGEKAPKLGDAIHENQEELSRRRRCGIDYNTEDTYTLCLYSSYVDFASWKAVNLPAIPKFSLAHINEAQPVSVRVYSLNCSNSDHGGKHLQKHLTDFLHVEFSHRGITTFGNGAKQWIQNSLNSREMTDDESLLSSSSSSFYTSFSGEGVGEEKKMEKKPCCALM